MTDFAQEIPSDLGRSSPSRVFDWLVRHPPVFTAILIVLVGIVVGTINPAFWQISNLFDMARASVVKGLFGLGVLIVLAA